MTEDYKKDLLDYATGNLQETSPTTDEITKEIIEKNRDNWIVGKILPNGFQDFHYEGLLQDRNTGNIILYGGYRAINSTAINNEVYGIITLLNGNFEPIISLFEYDSGTKLRYIQRLNQAEDGTFYMVDDTNFGYKYNDTILSSTKRLVLLNNFATSLDGDYKLILRSSYIFPSGYNIFQCENLQKNPEQAQYVMVGRAYDDWANIYESTASIELNIPYGSSPEWTWKDIVKSTNLNTNMNTSMYGNSIIAFSGDKYLVQLLASYQHVNKPDNIHDRYIRLYKKDYNSSNYTYTNILSNLTVTFSNIQYQQLENQCVFLNNNEVYFVMSNLENTTSGTQDLRIELWKYDINESNVIKIYENSYGSDVASHNEQLYLYANQGKLYIERTVKKGNNLGDYYYQRYDGTWNPILIGENKNYTWNQRNLFVLNKYNLLEVVFYPTNPRLASWYFSVAKEIYNPTQYNGESYVSKDSLCPLYSNLYSNGSLVFSRNLYNISKQNNMSMSSVEIPNSYLNDTTITQNDLIGETNVELVNDPTQWTKNIYEVVDLNFLNTINVIDEDTNTPYLESAIKLNNATVDGGDTNYQNTPCIKYRINYQDSTTSIHNFVWNTIDDTHKETEISLYVDKAIFSIDLLSNDESTIYISIPLNVEVGKYYTINQKIRIGG